MESKIKTAQRFVDNFMNNKKGQAVTIASIPGFILIIVMIIIFVGIGYLIGVNFLNTMTVGSLEYNKTNETIHILDIVVDNLDIVVLVIMFIIVIAVVKKMG